MSTAIIEINDSGLELAIDRELREVSPGFAVLDGKRLLIGREAMENARLLPRWTNNRFWHQLNTDAIANATPQVRHHADLAFAHLEHLWLPIKDEIDQVILLVPGFYQQGELSLLLGMTRELGMPVQGIADASLLAASDVAVATTLLHLDIHLHRITANRLAGGSLLTRADTSTVTEQGILVLWDRWANVIANQFIQTVRFDPLHEAATEQALFNQLPDWIRTLAGQRGGNFELTSSNGSHYTVPVLTDQLVAAAAQVYPQLVQYLRSQGGGDTALLLSHRFAGFPGLQDSLSLVTDLPMVELRAGQGLLSAFDQLDRIVSGDGTVHHIVTLPVTAPAALTPPAVQRVTHLLLGANARAIGATLALARSCTDTLTTDEADPACVFYRKGNDVMVESRGLAVRVNGAEINAATTLAPGDLIAFGECHLTAITVN